MAATELVDMGEETDEYVESTSKLRDLVKGYTGFDIMDDENNFKDLYEIVLGIGQAWGDLEDIQKAALGEALGGKRNARGLYSIFDHLDTLTSAYESSVNSAGSAMKEQEHYAESVQYSIDRTKASLQELSHDFLSSDLLKGLIEGANTFLQIVDNIISSLGTVGTLITGFGTASAVKGLATGDSLVGSLLNKAMGDKGTGDMRSNLKTLIGLGGNATREVESVGADLIEGVADGATSAASRAFEPAWKNATRTMANVDGELVEVWFDAQNNVIDNMDNISDIALRNGTSAGAAAASGFSGTYTAGVAGASTEAGAAMTATAGVTGTEAGGAAAAGFAAAFNPLVIAGLAGIGIIIGKAIYDHVQNVQYKAASSATDKYNDRKEEVSGYKDRYKTLYKDLHDNSKSEAERVQIREQILSLQQEITGAYGAEAAAVDLVNGELREQLDIMDGLVDKQIEKNNKDPNVKKGYADAKDAMTKSDKYDFGEILDGSKISSELRNAMSEIEGVDLVDGMEGTGTKIIRFEGDATGAKKAADEVQTILDDLQQKYIDDDDAISVLKHVNETMIPESNRLNEILDRHHDNYIAGLEQELTKQQRKDVDALGQAIKDLNTSAASGEGFEDAYNNYVDLLSDVNLDSTHMPIVDELKQGLDEAAISGQNFLDVINDDSHVGKNNPFAKDADSIKEYSESLKDLELQGIDVKEVLNDPLRSTNKGKEQILGLAKAFGVLGDDMKVNEDMVDSFITTLLNAGTIADSVSDTIEGKTTDSFDTFRSSIINDIANIDTLNSAIAESFSGKGLSYSIDENGEVVGSIAEIKKAYSELMEGKGITDEDLFERTANGIHLNQAALRELNSQLEKNKKANLTKQETQLLEEQERVRQRIATLERAGTTDNDTYRNLKSELDTLNGRVESIRELSAAYDGATSAYQKWVNAQSMGEEGQMYDAIRDTAIKRGKELYDQGLVGTNEFRSIAQLYSNEDLSTAPISKLVEAYEKGSASVNKFFTEGHEGAQKFLDAVDDLDMGIEKVGENDWVFNKADTSGLADYFGVSVDMIESVFRKLSDYGFDVSFIDDKSFASLKEVETRAQTAADSLKKIGDTVAEVNGTELKLSDVANFDVANASVEDLQSRLEQLKTFQGVLEANPNVNTEELGECLTLIHAIEEELGILDGTTASPNLTVGDIKQGQEAVNSIVQTLNDIDSMDPSLNIDIHNDEAAMSQLEYLSSFSTEQLSAAFGIDVETNDPEDILNWLMANKGSISTSATVDASVDGDSLSSSVDSAVSGTHPTVVPDADPSQAAEKTRSAIEDKQYNINNIKANAGNLGKQLMGAVSKAMPKVGTNKGTTTTNTVKEETVKTETTTKNEQTNITVSGNYDDAVKIRTAVASIPDIKHVKIDVDSNEAVAAIRKVDTTNVKDKRFNITAHTTDALSAIGVVNATHVNDKSFSITANWDNVKGAIDSIKRQLSSINDKTVRITTIKETRNVNKADGTAHWQGTAGGYYSQGRIGSVGNSFINHFNGTAHARGNWGLKRDEPDALVNELGPEIVVLCKLCYHVW